MTSPQVHTTPRPAPMFFQPPLTFSTKKERGRTPTDSMPPKPPIKSAPPISRIFPRKELAKALPVSFKSPEKSILSPHYNESAKDLFFDQCFEIECKLGVGSFGEVFKVRSKEDGTYYAVKRSRQKFRSESDRHRRLEEVAKHESLPFHPNCVGFVRAWEEKQHLYIQTELCKTSLNVFAEENHDIPERVIWNYLVDLLMAVKHLHDHDLVHMDIKPENIFVSSDNVCKLGDFGLVLDLTKDIEMSDAQEGDPKYLAPELMMGHFDKPADIFSLGITILELASDLDLPRGGDLWHQLRSAHLPEEFLLGVSHELKEVIRLMMNPDPTTRPTINQILQHPFISQIWRERQHSHHTTNIDFQVTLTTPEKDVRFKHPANWDHSFSDDDILDHCGCISISNNSMGAPLILDTSSSLSDDSFRQPSAFSIPSSLPTKSVSLPVCRRRALTNPTSSESAAIFDSAGSFYSSSPVSGSTVYYDAQLDKSITPSSSDIRRSEDMETNQVQPTSLGLASLGHASLGPASMFTNSPVDSKYNVEPKNLMRAFESALYEDTSEYNNTL